MVYQEMGCHGGTGDLASGLPSPTQSLLHLPHILLSQVPLRIKLWSLDQVTLPVHSTHTHMGCLGVTPRGFDLPVRKK